MAFGPPDGTAPHVVVADVERPALDAEAQHHLARVRRLREGDPMTVTDGRGHWRSCAFSSDGDPVPSGEVVVVDAPEPLITVAFALTKGDRPDLTVQKLTELGVDRIVAFRAERSVVRWDRAKEAKQLERWRAIVRGAVEQSHRCWLPEIAGIADVAELAALGAVRVDRGGGPPRLAHGVVAVGPEGGWSEAERRALPIAVGLGPHVLRAETAALTTGAVLCSIRSGLVLESDIAVEPAGK